MVNDRFNDRYTTKASRCQSTEVLRAITLFAHVGAIGTNIPSEASATDQHHRRNTTRVKFLC